MNDIKIKNFLSELNQVVTKYELILSKDDAALISKNNAMGRLLSGNTILQQIELIEKNFISAIDECLEFTLRYADEEGLSPEDLVAISFEALNKFKDHSWNKFEESSVMKKMGGAGVVKAVEEKKLLISKTLNTKIESANSGRVNGLKIYTGKITSQNLIWFNNLCLHRDQTISDKAPTLKKRFEALRPLLESDNSSHWANAVHECRKIFQELADELFPARSETRKKDGREIKLDSNSYINRLVCFVEDSNKSKTYSTVVSSQLDDFGKKLKAIFDATNKGSHVNLSQEHAYSFVAYTYLLVSDVLSLKE